MTDLSKFIKTILIFIMLLMVSNVSAQTGWQILNSGTTEHLYSIEFVNENTSYISGDNGTLLKTTNGGSNWQINIGLPGTDIAFVNDSTGFSANGPVYKTTNSGINWINLGSGFKHEVEFLDAMTGYACGDMDYNNFLVMSKTINGGATWADIYVVLSPPDLKWWNSLTMYDTQIGYIAYHREDPPRTQYIIKTIDGFNNWTTSFSSQGMYDAFAITMPVLDTLYFIGDDINTGTWFIYKGINDVWSSVYSTSVHLTDLFFTNAVTGYATGVSGLILKTTNGGLNWNVQNSGTGSTLWKVLFINAMTGYIAGDGGLILKTTNGGAAPFSISGTVRYEDNNQPVSSGYVKAFRYDEQTQNIIIVDSTGIQSNGAYTLIHCPPIPIDIMAFQDDEEDGYFVPTYYVSTIYWENATSVIADTNLTGIDIGVFRIDNSGGDKHIGGMVYGTSNLDLPVLNDAFIYARIGNEYKGYSLTGYQGTYQIDSLSSGTYELIANRMGYYSAIRPYQLINFSADTIDFVLSNILVSIQPNLQNIPVHYWISQNYPNPFNPSTKIKFGLPFQSHAKLVIYDVLGREMVVLLDEMLKAGEYSVEWNASVFSSGIYFYRLEARQVGSLTGDFVETRKMVLMK